MRDIRNKQIRRQKIMSLLFLSAIMITYLAAIDWLQHRTINRLQNIDIIDERNP